jgi:PAS domain S-box-containing protein
VVNENFRITTIRGNVQVFLGVPAETGIPLLDALKEDLAEPLRIVLSESRTEDMPAQRQALRFHIDGEIRLVDIQILPVSIPQQPVHYLVIFENLRAPAPPASDGTTRSGEADAQTIRQLEQRLVSGRQYLQTVIEELRSANEEVQSANEELQSTNEELQTAKEELQASNEELRTINDEMQNRNSELSQAHNDLANLLSSMNVPVLMLDNELRIRRFTPISEKILHLIASDVGRPIADLKVRINVPDIEQILRNVIATPTVYEREVQDEEGRWYAMRVRPYRTTENRIEGAVLQLVDIDEIKRGVERLRRARDYAEAIVNTVREPLVALHRGQRIQTANASFYQTFRLTPEDAADRTIYEIAHGKLDCPELHGLLDRAAEQDDEMQEVEIECDLRDRGLRNIVVNARSIHQDDGHGLTLLAFEDITERKQEAEARYRRLFEAAKDGILIADAETGEINDVNPFVEQLSGFTRQELIGKKLWEIEALGDIPDLQSAVERIRVEGTVRFPDVPIRTKDGRLVQAEVVANIYTEKKGRVIQFNIRDISERRKFFRQIQESQKLESLGLLAGGIAHDFNNLLTGIVGNASLALAESRPGELMRTYLRDVIRAGEQAAHLTRQMLAYAGKGRLVVQPVDVSSLIRETHPLIQSSIPKMVNLRFDLLENPPLVSGDPTQIQQLLMNLIINAGESIPEGMGGTVSVRTALRQITREDIADSFEDDDLEPGQYLLIEVTDTGVGMDEATKARIFDPFFTTKFTGRGLGLAAVRGLVKSHRGALHVFSTPGRGTTFTVLLPITAGQRPSTPEAPGTKEARTGHGTILVVDDDATVRQVAERGLSRNGYAVLLAKNGEEAVKLLRDHRDEVSLIVLDLTMPVMSGEQAFTELKSIRSDVPVIVSSGYDEAEAVRRFGGREFAGFLQKPYTAQRLLERVRNVLA